MNTVVKLENVSKKYKNKYIIKNLNLDIYEGEFLTLLGSSGCGKTTILRLISGLEEVTEGKIYLEGKDVTNTDPTKREVNTIFQNFALFPHMTVEQNIAFGLKIKKVPKNEIKKRTTKVIKLVKLEGYEDRLPSQLSGGQQQRVAIARGIIMNPKVLLLDESLCSLDLKLKKKMQIELKKIQKKLGITFIYVTHNQEEALTMSDRIAIINKGNIEQFDTPYNIYKHPKNLFVADFIGESNIIKGQITNLTPEQITVTILNNITISLDNTLNLTTQQTINLVVRPEDIKTSKTPLKNSYYGIVKETIYNGDITKVIININNEYELKANIYNDTQYQKNEIIYFKISNEEIVIIGDKKNAKEK